MGGNRRHCAVAGRASENADSQLRRRSGEWCDRHRRAGPNLISKSAPTFLFVCAFFACAGSAHAEFGVPYFTPERPQPGDTVFVNIEQGGCDGITGPDPPEITQNGNAIYMLAQGVRYTDPELCTLTHGIATFTIGAFPEGDYYFQLDLRYPNAGGDFVIETLAALTFHVYDDSALAHVDLSLHVDVSPGRFTPGGGNTVVLAVHNDGPDVAGATIPDVPAIDVIQDPFLSAEGGPPFEIRAVSGCFVIEAVGDPDIFVAYVFIFGPIEADETRTCTYDIEFYPWSVATFSTGWQVYTPNDIDTDPSNDRVDYLFQAAAEEPAAVDAVSTASLGFLLLALATLGTRHRVAVAQHRPAQR